MGTRGLLGFVVDGQVRGTYNHFDSYPSVLGVNVGDFARLLLADSQRRIDYAEKARRVVVVDQNAEPTAEERLRFARFFQDASTGRDWYALLRYLQGNLAGYLDAGFWPDGLGFAYDSLFCEWGYLVNFDTGMVEVYRGFNQDEPKGRFAEILPGVTPDRGTSGYNAITLLVEIPFENAGIKAVWNTLEAVNEA